MTFFNLTITLSIPYILSTAYNKYYVSYTIYSNLLYINALAIAIDIIDNDYNDIVSIANDIAIYYILRTI